MERAVFLKVHQLPIVIGIVINSRYSHLQVMIGSMQHLDEQNLISLEERMYESKYTPQVTASFINSYRQPTARDSGSRWSHPHRMYLALVRSTTRESVLRMLNHLDPLQILEKMARVVGKTGPAVLVAGTG